MVHQYIWDENKVSNDFHHIRYTCDMSSNKSILTFSMLININLNIELLK